MPCTGVWGDDHGNIDAVAVECIEKFGLAFLVAESNLLAPAAPTSPESVVGIIAAGAGTILFFFGNEEE